MVDENDEEVKRKKREAAKARKAKYLASEKGKAKTREYSKAHAAEIAERGKEWYRKNKERRRAKGYEWIKNNPEAYKKLYERSNRKRQEDPIRNLAMRVRGALSKSFRKTGLPKRKRTFEYLGYTNTELYVHLSQWLEKPCVVCGAVNVVLENSNIDHIAPMCLASSEDDIVRLNQLSNLRLICESCNLAKVSNDLQVKKEQADVRLESVHRKDRKG